MSTQVICDYCFKPLDIRAFNESQSTVHVKYDFCTTDEVGIYNKDVCPRCAIAILTQLVQAWGG